MSKFPFVGFAGVPFHVLAPSGKVPDWDANPVVITEHIPGSNTAFTQNMGWPHARISCLVEFDSIDDYRAVKARTGTQDTLVLLNNIVTMRADEVRSRLGTDYAVYGNVLLVSIDNPEMQVDINRPVACSLTFQTEVRL